MKKKMIVLLLFSSVALVLTACSNPDADDRLVSNSQVEVSTNKEENILEQETTNVKQAETDSSEEERETRTMPELTSKNVEEYIKGNWKLLSYVENGKNTIDYSEQERIWRFDGSSITVDSDEFGGEITSSYSVRQAVLRSDVCIVVQSEGLKVSHMPYGKLIVTEIKNNILTIVDWFGDITYTLEYVGE